MIVYKDKLTNDELFTDTYKIEEDECFYKVFGEYTVEKTDADFDIGANPSAEEEEEKAQEGEVEGCNIVIANRLVETNFGDKPSYKKYIQGYIKSLLPTIEKEDHADFKKRTSAGVLDPVLKNFKKWRFFLGESMDPDGMVALLDDITDPSDPTYRKPYMLFFKDGILEEKQ